MVALQRVPTATAATAAAAKICLIQNVILKPHITRNAFLTSFVLDTGIC